MSTSSMVVDCDGIVDDLKATSRVIALPDLAGYRRRIEEGHRLGRPSWFLGLVPGKRGDYESFEVRVPRLEQVPVGRSLVTPYEYSSGYKSARLALGPDLLTTIETGHPYLMEKVSTNRTADARMRYLTAAVLRDLHGWNFDGDSQSINAFLGYSSAGNKAVGAVKQGRSLWERLAAWPWWGGDVFGGIGDWIRNADIRSRFEAWSDPTSWSRIADQDSSPDLAGG